MRRRRSRWVPSGRLVAVALVTAGVCGLAIGVGVTTPFVVSVTLLTAVAGCAWLTLRVADGEPPRVEGVGARPGTRSDVAWLTWSLSSRGRGLEGQALERTRTAIRTRLARRGLDPADPRTRAELEELLGAASWRLVSGDGRRVALVTVEQCLDALDALDARETPRGVRR